MKNAHVATLIEDFDSKLDAIIEVLSTKASSADLKSIDDRLQRVEISLEAAIETLVDQGTKLDYRAKRFAKLEIA